MLHLKFKNNLKSNREIFSFIANFNILFTVLLRYRVQILLHLLCSVESYTYCHVTP